MEIDKDYLAQLFESDQIFVFPEEGDAVEYDLKEDHSTTREVKEPQNKIEQKPSELESPHKEVVILVNKDLGNQEKETLNKLLKAINIEEGQFEIIQEHPERLKSIQHLKLFLSFHNQYVQSSEYAILKINKGNAIYAHDLVELNKDSSKKLMLWNLLKTIV